MTADRCKAARDEHKLSGQVEDNDIMLCNTKAKTSPCTFPQLMLKRWSTITEPLNKIINLLINQHERPQFLTANYMKEFLVRGKIYQHEPTNKLTIQLWLSIPDLKQSITYFWIRGHYIGKRIKK